MPQFRIQRIENGAFRENAWLAFCGGAGDAVLVDPGDCAERLVAAARAADATVKAVLLTHGHVDHLSALPGVLAAFPGAVVRLSAADAAWCFTGANELPPYRVPPPPPPGVLADAADGCETEAGGILFRAIATPGHSPGGTCWLALDAAAPDSAPLALFSGDTLFAGSIGRTDFPGSDPAAMERSLARLCALPPATPVFPGHGPATTVARELATNPWLRHDD